MKSFTNNRTQMSLKTIKDNDYIINPSSSVKSLFPSEAETLLEEKLGIKVKIKN